MFSSNLNGFDRDAFLIFKLSLTFLNPTRNPQHISVFQEEIKDEIDKICAKLTTADLQKQCASFVDEYLQLVLSLLAQELDPNAVCQEIGLCTKIRASTGELYKYIITRRFF